MINSIPRRIFNIKWYFSPERKLSSILLKTFKNKHKEERCFIIGNGPSLNKMDLSFLNNEITFGLNRFYLLFEKLGFHSTYFVSVNKLVVEQCSKEISRLPMPKFLSWKERSLLPIKEDIVYLKTIGGEPQFAFDLNGTVWESATVTYVALQIAFFMGFKTVILIGVDHNFSSKGKPNSTIVSEGSDPNHFSPEYFGKGFKWQLPDLETSELGYELAKRVYRENGREILDATIGGKLNIFPKIEYSSLF